MGRRPSDRTPPSQRIHLHRDRRADVCKVVAPKLLLLIFTDLRGWCLWAMICYFRVGREDIQPGMKPYEFVRDLMTGVDPVIGGEPSRGTLFHGAG